MPQIRLRDVEKHYGGDGPQAVSTLNLTIEDGDFMCMLGPSGCGKTTTLRMIAGLEHPTSGSISVGDTVMDSVAEGTFVPAERRGMGLVFQTYALWPHLTVEKNIAYGVRLRKLAKAQQRTQVAAVMKTMGIERYGDRYPSQLSGGQQQRVALARMLAVNPDVMLLDEPLSNLDSRLRLEMRAELGRIHREFGSTVVFVTHDQWEAMTLATRIAVMFEGRLQQLGTPTDIYDRPANRFVAEFLGNPPMNIIELGTESPDTEARRAAAYYVATASGATDVASVGFRPEAVRVLDSAPLRAGIALNADVSALLPTGGSWIIETVRDGQRFFAVSTDKPNLTVGQPVCLFADAADTHAFDRDGRRVHELDHAQTEVSTR